MYIEEFPGCCGLDVITPVEGVLGTDNDYLKQKAETINTLIENQAGVCVHTDMDKGEYRLAAKFLLSKGWKLLGVFPGNHQTSVNKYNCYLWGSPQFITETKHAVRRTKPARQVVKKAPPRPARRGRAGAAV